MKQHPPQPENLPADLTSYIAKVPVQIWIEDGETTIDEYEEVVVLKFTDSTFAGKRNKIGFRALTTQRGYSTEQALSAIAYQRVEERLQEQFASRSTSSAHELEFHIQRNGAISFGKVGPTVRE